MSFWNTTKDWLFGTEGPAGQSVEFSDVLGSVNWGGVAGVAGSYFLSNSGFTQSSPDAGGGYRGDIPNYTAVRQRVADTYDPNRRPGSGGQRYFSDMQYVDPYEPITPEIEQAQADAAAMETDTTADDITTDTTFFTADDGTQIEEPEYNYTYEEAVELNQNRRVKSAKQQAAIDAAINLSGGYDTISGDNFSAVDDTIADTTAGDTITTLTASEDGLAALDAVRQLAGKQAEYLQAANIANPAYETRPTALNINPTGATGIQALQAKNATTAGSGVSSLLPIPQYDAQGNVITMAAGGIANLAAGGRYLNGATDGMADRVPANIDGKQPAALSDGEFVIPADVVSHLGNGNSNAGAKALHDMMANVRQDRTGNSKQGKQINAASYMPRMR